MKLTALAVVVLALGIVVGIALAGGSSGGPASAVPQCPGPSANCATPTPSPTPAPPPTATLIHTILHPNPAPPNRFGESVASVGNNVFVGSPGDVNQGAVHVFDSTTGDFLFTITSPEPLAGAEFGLSIARVGGNILVSAKSVSQDGVGSVGRAYLFNGTTGTPLLTFLNPNPIVQGRFGVSVAAVGENILIGAPGNSVGGEVGVGSVYLFDGTTGDLLLTIPNPEPERHDNFGQSVAGVGSNIVVGVPQDDPGAVTAAGSVYTFNGTTGVLLLTIRNPAPARDNFGFSVAPIGANILIGAPRDNPSGVQNAGTAYVFDGTTGDLLLTIPNPELGIVDEFGYSVASVDSNILVGTPGNQLFDGRNVGSVYLFDGTTGDLILSIPNPAPGDGDEFGISVAGMGESIIVGAWADKPEDSQTVGTAYLFETGGTP